MHWWIRILVLLNKLYRVSHKFSYTIEIPFVDRLFIWKWNLLNSLQGHSGCPGLVFERHSRREIAFCEGNWNIVHIQKWIVLQYIDKYKTTNKNISNDFKMFKICRLVYFLLHCLWKIPTALEVNYEKNFCQLRCML